MYRVCRIVPRCVQLAEWRSDTAGDCVWRHVAIHLPRYTLFCAMLPPPSALVGAPAVVALAIFWGIASTGRSLMTRRQRPTLSEAHLEQLRHRRKRLRRQVWRKSKLDAYTDEIVELRRAGASFREIAILLRKHHRVRVAHGTVRRFILKHHASLSQRD